MTILIISTSDIRGGAAIAANRLMKALQKQGNTVSMMVCHKASHDNNIHQVGTAWQNRWNFYAERATIFCRNHLTRQYLFDVSIANTGVDITDTELFKKADVIHLHWINQGMLSMKQISKIVASGKKVVWTMHDMWPFTGICHHAGECKKYEEQCGKCPYLNTKKDNDMAHQLLNKKQSIYQNRDITFVACSHWLERLARNSVATSTNKVTSIANPIDTSIYAPQPTEEARQVLGLPTDKKLVLFAAMKSSDKRKGMDYLVEASRLLSDYYDDMAFVVAGAEAEEVTKQLSLPSIAVGYLPPERMPLLYNAVDMFVTPSLQENLPNTIMEAMACGTPCVGFEIGGIPEMIVHHTNGYIAHYQDADDLARGIRWIAFEADYEALSTHARTKVLMNYAEDIIAKKYMTIYDEA